MVRMSGGALGAIVTAGGRESTTTEHMEITLRNVVGEDAFDRAG